MKRDIVLLKLEFNFQLVIILAISNNKMPNFILLLNSVIVSVLPLYNL